MHYCDDFLYGRDVFMQNHIAFSMLMFIKVEVNDFSVHEIKD